MGIGATVALIKALAPATDPAEIEQIEQDVSNLKNAIHGTKETEYNSFGILPLEWEKGDINKSTGEETGTTNIRTLFVKVNPSTQYRVYTLNSKSWKYCQYSTNNVNGFISGHGAYSGNNITITTASTANYLRFVVTCSPSDLNEANYIIVVNDDDLQSIGRTFINENNSVISSNDTFESLSKMKLNRRYQVSGSVMAQYSDSPSTKSVNAIVMKFHGATKSGLNYVQLVMYMDNTLFYRTTTNGGTSWTSWTEIFSYYDMKSVMSEIVLSSAQKKILLLGDSITQGVGSTGIVHFTDANDIVVWGNAPDYPDAGAGYQEGDHIYDLSNIRRYYEAIDGSGWAQKFKAYCQGKFNCIVKNYGMSGINSRVLLDYLSQATYPVPGYDIAIVMIGTNDRYDSANIPKATCYSNICSIVDKLREHGTKVILMAATPATTVDEENASARVYHMDDVDHIIMKVANDKRVPFISMFSAMNDYCLFTGTTLASLLNNDGLHPNDTGYAVMYRLILRELGIPKRDDVQ